MHREALWSAVLSERVPELWLDEHRRVEADRKGGRSEWYGYNDRDLGGGGLYISYLNKTTKTPLHISHIIQVKFVSASQKLLLFPAWLISIYPLRATIGYLKIMLQAAGPRAADCRHLRITTEELSGMFVSIQPLNRSEGLNGQRTFLEMETPTTSTPMTRDGLPQVQTGCWWECFPQLSSRNDQILSYFSLTITNYSFRLHF